MPLIYCAVPDITFLKDGQQPSANPFLNRIEPTQWFTAKNKVSLSATVSSLNPNLPGLPSNNILNRLDIGLKKAASSFDSRDGKPVNKNFAPLLAYANIFCLMVSTTVYDRLQKEVTTNDLFSIEPGEFNIIGVYQAPASGRTADNLPFIIVNTSAEASLKAEFLKVCTQAIEESRPTLAGIFQQEQDKYKNEQSFTLDNKELPEMRISSAEIRTRNKNSQDPVKIMTDIQTILCGELEKEMDDFLKRNHVSGYNQLNETKKARYDVIEELHYEIVVITQKSIQELNITEADVWKKTYQDRLKGAIQRSLNDNKADKYNNLEKIGLRLLNMVTILFSPIKRAFFVSLSWL